MKPIVFYPNWQYLVKLYLTTLVTIPIHLFITVWFGSFFFALLRTFIPSDPRPLMIGAAVFYGLLMLVLPYLYFKSIRYQVSEDNMTASSGLLNKSTRHVRYQAIVDIQIQRDLVDQLLGVGTLQVRASGSALPVIVMKGVRDIDGLFDFVVDATQRKQDELLDSSYDQQDILQTMVNELRAIRTGDDVDSLPAGSRTQRLTSGKR